MIEANLSYAASLAAHAIRLGSQVDLTTADGSTGFGQGEAHLDRILDRLALYEAPAPARLLAIPMESGRVVHVRLDTLRQMLPLRRTLEAGLTVPFPQLFKLTLYLLVLDAFGALYLTGILDWPGLAGVLLAILGSWWADEIRARIPNYRRLWDAHHRRLSRLRDPGSAFPGRVVHRRRDPSVVVPAGLPLYNARTHRDLLDLFILTFLQLVAACSLTVSFGFLLVFCLYMILGTWGLILYHLKRETELALPERSRELLARSDLVTPGFLLSSVGVAVASLLLTLAIFFAIPRVGRTYLPLRAQIGTMSTGFTDRVDLGTYGTIQNDPTIVMRVSFPESVVSPDRLPDLRWRGVAFDQFRWAELVVARSRANPGPQESGRDISRWPTRGGGNRF